MSKRAIFLGGKRPAATVVSDFISDSPSPLEVELTTVAPTVVAGAGGSPFSEVPSSQWRLSDFNSSLSFSTSSSASGINCGANVAGFFSYGMRWELDIEAGATIVSATLVVRTTDSYLSTKEDAEMFIGQHQSADSPVPADGDAARAMTSRCASQWASSTDLFGGSGSVEDTEYSIDVKDQIEYSVDDGGWAAGNGLTLILCGPASDLGAGCETQETESNNFQIQDLSEGDYQPKLTVVYT